MYRHDNLRQQTSKGSLVSRCMLVVACVLPTSPARSAASLHQSTGHCLVVMTTKHGRHPIFVRIRAMVARVCVASKSIQTTSAARAGVYPRWLNCWVPSVTPSLQMTFIDPFSTRQWSLEGDAVALKLVDGLRATHNRYKPERTMEALDFPQLLSSTTIQEEANVDVRAAAFNSIERDGSAQWHVSVALTFSRSASECCKSTSSSVTCCSISSFRVLNSTASPCSARR